jgi:hypothetical protein
LFLVSREAGRKLYRLSAMDDEEDQETPFRDGRPIDCQSSLGEAVRS